MGRLAPKPITDLPVIKDLPELQEFAGQMKRLLTFVQRSEVDSLLKCLYRAAERKIELERRRRNILEDDGNAMREKKRSMSQIRKLLNDALQSLKKAKLQDPEALAMVQFSARNEECFSLRGSIRYLQAAVGQADYYQLVFSGLMHPHVRKRPVETRQAEQELAEGIAAGTIVSHQYPASPDSPDIDHWFIGAAADCLDQYKTGAGKKIPTYDGIIVALFRVAFDDVGRSAGSIRIELRRQKKEGRPTYVFFDPNPVGKASTP